MVRLGVAVRVLGRQGLQIGRRDQHLSAGLLQLRDTLIYLAGQRISCYRLPDTLLPTTENELEYEAAIEGSEALLAEVGGLAREAGIRLSIHPGLHVALATLSDIVAQRAAAEVVRHARLLDALGCGPESVVVLHVGGAHDEPQAALQRFAARYERLPEAARRRVVVEADEHSFNIAELMWLRRCCGVPLVFDLLHFQLNNPARMALREALGLALATWPAGVRPKIHVSSQRTEAHLQPGRAGAPARIIPPRRGQHADYLNPFEVISMIRAAGGLPSFDIMLEAKAADLALLRLREDIRDLAPDVARIVS